MKDSPNQLFVIGQTLQTLTASLERIGQFPLAVGRNVILEFFEYNDSVAGGYDLWEVRYNGGTIWRERLRTDNQTLRVNLPFFKLVPPGTLEIFVGSAAIGRLYTFTLWGKYENVH